MRSRDRSPAPFPLASAALSALLLLMLTGPAAAQTPTPDPAAAAEAEEPTPQAAPSPEPIETTTTIRLHGLKGGKLIAGKRVSIKGTVRPFIHKAKVTVVIKRGKKTYKRIDLKVVRGPNQANFGRFKFAKRLIKPGAYSAHATLRKRAARTGSSDSSRRFKIKYPALRKDDKGPTVKTLNKLLAKLGYVNDEGRRFDAATGRAVLAFRKVNGLSRTEKASGKIFKKLARGKGGFKLRHPGAGKHVEADLSRQVMVLAKGRKVKEIYHVSSGTSATPTIQGKFRFYRKEPGYNSLGMYYSVYFIRGYAIHGYQSVPTYPASHGCLRNPIPNSKHIYDWVDIGDPIYVYP